MKKLLLLLFIGFQFNLIGQFKTDSIFILSAPKAFLELQEIKKNPLNDSLLNQFSIKFQKEYDDSLQFGKIKEENPDLYEMNLFASRQKQNEFLKAFNKSTLVSADCFRLVENTIKYQYWYLLLAHPVRLSNLKTEQLKLISLPEIMTQNLDFKKINLQENLQSESFRKLLPFLVTYFNSKSNKFEKYKDLSKAAIDKFNYADNTFSSEIMQFYLTDYLNQNCNQISPSILKILISNLEIDTRNLISIKCNEAINKKEEVIVDAKAKKDEWGLTNVDNLPLPMTSMKGKVIYVDFWATWCGPCKREFPFSMQMMDKLTEKDKKKIEFLFISIDDDAEVWKTALAKNKLGGKHGWINGGWGSKLLSKFQVNSIPRYMIIDQKGNVINPNAPRPSEEGTLDLLLKIANEK